MRPSHTVGLLLLSTLSACASAGTPGPAITAPDAVTVHNHSGYGVFHLYLGAVGSHDAWGEDFLGRSPLHDDRSTVLRGAACGHYDVRLVDEDGDECLLHNQDVCRDPEGLTLNSAELAACSGWTSSVPVPAPVATPAPTATPAATSGPSAVSAQHPVGCTTTEVSYQAPCARPGVDCPTDRPPLCLVRCRADADCTDPHRSLCVTVGLGPAANRCQNVTQVCLDRPTGECP